MLRQCLFARHEELGSLLNNSSFHPTSLALSSSSSSSSSTNNVNNLSAQNDVPWHEINAGVGMIALLISNIQSKLRIGSRFTILPRGSTTKVCFNTSTSNVQGRENGTTVLLEMQM